MFTKLIKHEITAVSRWYLGLYGAVLVLSLIAGFWLRTLFQRAGFTRLSQLNGSSEVTTNFNTGVWEGIFFILIILLWMATFIALFLSTLFLIIRRFKDSIYGRQGYLTLTLPVSQTQIILSKLTGALFWSLLSGLTAYLSILIMGATMISQFPEFQELVTHHLNMGLVTELVSGIIPLMISLSSQILLIYLAVGIGQLVDRYQNALAFLAFVGINLGVTSVGAHLALSLSAFNFLYIPYQIAFAVLYFFGIRYLLTHKVNLN